MTAATWCDEQWQKSNYYHISKPVFWFYPAPECIIPVSNANSFRCWFQYWKQTSLRRYRWREYQWISFSTSSKQPTIIVTNMFIDVSVFALIKCILTKKRNWLSLQRLKVGKCRFFEAIHLHVLDNVLPVCIVCYVVDSTFQFPFFNFPLILIFHLWIVRHWN